MLAFVIILIVLLIRVTTLADKVRSLEWELRNVQKMIMQSAQGIEPTSSLPTAQTPPPAPSARPPHQPFAQPPLTPTFAEPITTPQAAQPIQPPLHIPEKAPSRTREEFEAFIGGKLLNRIGALALIIGVGFFLKYAFDNNWITETMRVIIGFAVGTGILFGGMHTHKKGFEIFAQGLFGAGISILYLSIYASFNFYHLVSQVVAFGLMTMVTIAAFVLAFKYDSLAISILAWAGGFLTPFLLSTGQANEVGLFTYIAFLEAGLLAIVMKKSSWLVLEPLTLVGTYLVFLSWHHQYYVDNDLGITVFFLSVFWGLFFLLDLYRTLSAASTQIPIRQIMNLFNGGFYYISLYHLINPSHHQWMGATTLIICLVYLLHVIVIWKREGDSKMLAQNIFITTMLLILATAIQYSGFTTVMFWSIEACVLVWCASRWNLRNVAFFAVGLLVIAVIKLVFTSGAFSYTPLENFTLLLNYRALAYAVLAASFFTSAILLQQLTQRETSIIVSILHPLWIIILFTLTTVEVNDMFMQQMTNVTSTQHDYMDFAKIMTMACVWTFYSLPLVYFGLKKAMQSIAVSGLMVVTVIFFMAVIRGFAFAPIEYFYPLLNVRTLAIFLVLSGMCFHSLGLKQSLQRYNWSRDVYSTLLVASILLLLSLLTGETRDIFEQQLYLIRQTQLPSDIGAQISRIENQKQLSLSGLWLLYGIALMVVGIWRRLRGMRILAIVLLGIAILKIFVYDLSSLETLYRIFSFIGLGIILLAASYLYQKYKSIIVDVSPQKK